MKRSVIAILLISVAFIMSAHAEKTDKTVQLLFVQNAHSVAFKDRQLTLQRVSPTTVFFADRPERVVGHMTTAEFVSEWTEGQNSFAADPPNAALSIFHDDKITDVVVTLLQPRLNGQDLVYDVRILDGDMPASGGESSLFIDPVGRPASPGSVAGVHRRQRRRVERHVVNGW